MKRILAYFLALCNSEIYPQCHFCVQHDKVTILSRAYWCLKCDIEEVWRNHIYHRRIEHYSLEIWSLQLENHNMLQPRQSQRNLTIWFCKISCFYEVAQWVKRLRWDLHIQRENENACMQHNPGHNSTGLHIITSISGARTVTLKRSVCNSVIIDRKSNRVCKLITKTKTSWHVIAG